MTGLSQALLAAHTAPTPPGGSARVRFLNHEELTRLAVEVSAEPAEVPEVGRDT